MVNQVQTFATTDTTLYVLIVTLSTHDNAKPIEQLKWSFKTTINRKKYQSKISIERPNQYSNYLIDPSFYRANRLFVLSFDSNNYRASYKQYFFPKFVEIKDYNVTIDEQNLFRSTNKKNNLRAYKDIQKIVTD